MSYSVTRLAVYAILSSVEEDLRDAIRVHLAGQGGAHEVLGDDIWRRVNDRLAREMGVTEKAPSLEEALPFADFGDLLKVLNASYSSLPPETARHFREVTPDIEGLLPIRHRTAHIRPLHFDDLANATEVASSLTKKDGATWQKVGSVLKRLEKDPGFVLGLDIRFFDTDIDAQRHNLPTPDFDETGFVGRKQQVDLLVKHCLGPYPVITVVGEGGMGKTALALKVAYDILDLPTCPFEAIVWSSAKTAQLTPYEVMRIEGAIQDSLGMFQQVAGRLAGVRTEKPFEEVLEYLGQFRILLILDNLETVLDDRIRSFLERLPAGSKVLTTSRIGLGAFEVPVKLEAMNQSESVQLLRALARVRGTEELVKMPNHKLKSYCERMKNNPGWIKWFVSAIRAGKRPEEVLANPQIFLDFCMSNVFDFLTEHSRRVLMSLLCVPGRKTQAELKYLNDMEVRDLQQAIQELLRTNMMIMTCAPRGLSFESQYELSELARDYLGRRRSPSSDDLKSFSKRKRQLVAAGEEIKSELSSNPYSFGSISLRSKQDLPVAKYLLDALKALKRKKFSEAEGSVADAVKLAPDYFEVYRVDALVKLVGRNDLAGAQSSYEAAMEVAPNSAPLKFWYGGFLMRYLDDVEGGLRFLTDAAEVDPKALEIQIELARANLYLKKFDESNSMVEELLARSGLSVWDQRQIWDLRLQFFQRKAEYVLDQHHDELGALESLRRLKQIYSQCPAEILDSKMRERLKKGIRTAQDCSRFLNESQSSREISELVSWMASESGLTYDERVRLRLVTRLEGVISRKQAEAGFGFIRCDDGREFYFSLKAVRNVKEHSRNRQKGVF